MKIFLLVSLVLIVISARPIILMGGQSNMLGCGCVLSDVPHEFQGQEDLIQIISRGGFTRGPGPLEPGYGAADACIGPELSFGKLALYMLGPFTISKVSWGGTNLFEQWRPPSAGNPGELYWEFARHSRESLQTFGQSSEDIRAMLWMQGESDNASLEWANAYESLLTLFIQDIRNEFQNPKIKFIIGPITQSELWQFHEIVRAAQIRVASNVPNCAFLETADIPLQSDKAHYTTLGQIELGKRFFMHL